ncbi:hypothetical protein BC628DRAFT_359650 [Trametes gibbosa]|nr:hypothetical protein BC628DRAFT_359650 [Trametes gibbosa]
MASPSMKRSDTTPSASSRPSSPSPARSMRTRMTSVMRRASTGLAFSSKLPTLSRSSSKNSLRVDPTQAPTTSETHGAPSPVAETGEESPSVPATLGPSPLHNSSAAPEQEQVAEEPVVQPEPVPEPAHTPASVVVPALAEDNEEERLTRSPEQFSSELPHAAPALVPELQPFGFSDPILPATQAPVVLDSPAPAPSDAPLSEATPPHFLEPASAAHPPVEPAARPALEDHRADYFSFGDPVDPVVAKSEDDGQPPVPSEVPIQSLPVAQPAQYQTVSHVQIPTDESTFAWSDEPGLGHKRSRSSLSEPPLHALDSSQHSEPQSGKVSTRASKSSMASSYGNVIPNTSGTEQRRGRSSSVRCVHSTIYTNRPAKSTCSFVDPAENPFADPPEATKNLSPIESVNMPECVFWCIV